MTGLADRQPVVVLRAVCRTYQGPPEVAALGPADLAVYPGEYLAITGPSGSGKSTLLNILGLLDRPTSGSYELDGVEVAALSETDRTTVRGQKIGFVFQEFHLLPYRTAVENVALALVYAGQRRPAVRRRWAVEALDRVGLAHRLDALPGTLSGGERQRVAIARALVKRPGLILCDEPTGNLDSKTAGNILGLLDAMQSDGQTVIVITHDIAVARGAQRTVRMLDGRLAETRHAGCE